MALVRCEVSVAVDGEESVPTDIVIDGGDTYTSLFDLYLLANILAVTCWR